MVEQHRNPFQRRGAFELEMSLLKKLSIVNATIRTFFASAFLNNSYEIVEATSRRGRGADAFAEPILERLLVTRPCRAGMP